VLSKVELKDSAVDIIEAITVEIEGEERPAMYAEWIGRLVFDS
jgi:acyl dehydratase